MKKVIIFLFGLTLFGALISHEDKTVIPKESLRFRIIGNSNSMQDQALKVDIRAGLIPILQDVTENVDSIEAARKNIVKNLDKIEAKTSEYTDLFSVNFGQNYFPPKIYREVLYKEGTYESLVITLGEGNGDNWWCVLFPPLCLLEAEENNFDNVTYDSYIKNIINKYL